MKQGERSFGRVVSAAYLDVGFAAASYYDGALARYV